MKRGTAKILSLIYLTATIAVAVTFAIRDKPKEPVKYISYTVSSGETLWSISRDIAPDTDPREVVYLIRQKNNITPVIYPGQTILVPEEVK